MKAFLQLKYFRLVQSFALTFLLVLLIGISAIAQQIHWHNNGEIGVDKNSNVATGIATDSLSNSYNISYMRTLTDKGQFGDSTYTKALSSVGCLGSYDDTGAVRWVHWFGGATNSIVRLSDIEIIGSKVYVAMQYYGDSVLVDTSYLPRVIGNAISGFAIISFDLNGKHLSTATGVFDRISFWSANDFDLVPTLGSNILVNAPILTYFKFGKDSMIAPSFFSSRRVIFNYEPSVDSVTWSISLRSNRGFSTYIQSTDSNQTILLGSADQDLYHEKDTLKITRSKSGYLFKIDSKGKITQTKIVSNNVGFSGFKVLDNGQMRIAASLLRRTISFGGITFSNKHINAPSRLVIMDYDYNADSVYQHQIIGSDHSNGVKSFHITSKNDTYIEFLARSEIYFDNDTVKLSSNSSLRTIYFLLDSSFSKQWFTQLNIPHSFSETTALTSNDHLMIQFRAVPPFSLADIVVTSAQVTGSFPIFVAKLADCRYADTATLSSYNNRSICSQSTFQLSALNTDVQYQWMYNGIPLAGENDSLFNGVLAGTYSLEINDNGCKDTSTSIVVSSKQATQIIFPQPRELCTGDSVFILNEATPSGGVYRGFGVVNDSVFNSKITGKGIFPVTYSLVDANGCKDSIAKNVKVGGSTVLFTPLADVCLNHDSVSLTQGFPLGGNYFGVGVNSAASKFSPLSAGVGNSVIGYSYQKGACFDTTYQTTHVDTIPVVSLDSISPLCDNTFSINLTQGKPVGGTYLSPYAIGNKFYPVISGNGQFDLGYVFQDGNGCNDTAQINVQIDPSDTSRLTAPWQLLCANTPEFQLTGGSPWGGKYYVNGNQDSLLRPSTLGAGAYTLQYKIDNTCRVDSSAKTITIEVPPSTQLTLDSTSCTGAAAFILTGGLPSGGNYFVNNNPGSTLNSSTLGVGIHTVKYKVSNAKGCQDSIIKNVEVHPQPIVLFNAVPDQCNNSVLGLTQGKPSGGSYSGNGISGNSFSGSTAGTGNHNLKYVLTDSNNCTDSASTVVTVIAPPSLSHNVLAEVCENSDTLSLVGGTPIGGKYEGIGIVNDSNFVPSIAGAGIKTIYYTFESACGKDSIAVSIKVNAKQLVSLSPIANVCANADPVNLIGGLPIGGQYSGNGILTTNGQFNPGIGQGSYAIQYSFTDTNNCSDSASQLITVDSVPVVTFGSIANQCLNSSPLTLTTGLPIGGSYSGNGVGTGVFTPISVQVGLDTVSYKYTDGNGCSDSANATIQVDSVPNVTLSLPNKVCQGLDSLILTRGQPLGGTYQGSGVFGSSFKPDSVPAGLQTITYKFTDGNNCSNSVTDSIEVNAKPQVSLASIANVCANADTINLSGGLPNGGAYSGVGVIGVQNQKFNPRIGKGTYTIKYSFTDTNNCSDSASQALAVDSVPIVSIGSIANLCLNSNPLTLNTGLPIGGIYSGNGVSSGIFTPSSIITATVGYKYTNGKGCSDSSTASIQVDSVPIVNLSLPKKVCQGLDSLFLTSGQPQGGIYQGSGVFGSSFKPDSVTAGIQTITYTYTDGNNCSNTITDSINVNARPQVSLSAIANVCANADTINLTGGLPSGGQYSGVGVLNQKFIPGTGKGTYTVHYSYTDTNNCSDSAIQVITVDSVPVVSIGSIANQCLNSSPLTLNTGFPLGGIYSGNGVGVGVFTPSSIITVTVGYKYTNGKGCSDSSTASIQVDSIPIVKLSLPNKVCQGLDSLMLTGGQPQGGLYQGSGVFGSFFKPDSVSAGLQTLTYLFTDGNNCSNSASDTIKVNARPLVSLSPLAATCANSDSILLAGGLPTGGHFKGVGVGVQTQKFNPQVGQGQYTLQYVFSDTNNCRDSASQVLTVDSVPVVTIGRLANQCLNSSPLTLNTGLPIGGTYSGNGVSVGMFTPSSIGVGVGVDTIYYNFTDGKGCSDSSIATIRVDSVPIVSLTMDSTLCKNTPLFNVQMKPAGGLLTGRGISGNNYDVSLFGTAKDTVKYVFIDANNCKDSVYQWVRVDSVPLVSLDSLTSICDNSGNLILSGASPVGGSYFGNHVNSSLSTFSPTSSGIGSFPISYVFADLNQCADSVSRIQTVLESPKFTLGNDTMICALQLLELSTGLIGKTHKWDDNSAGIKRNVTQGGNYSVVVTNSNSCSASDTIVVSYEEVCTGIEEIVHHKISIFPNPTEGNLTIDFGDETNAEIEIRVINAIGKSIYHLNESIVEGQQIELQLLDQPAGVYHVSILIGNQQVLTKQIIKLK